MIDVDTEKGNDLMQKIEFKDVSPKEIDRYLKIIQILIGSGGLDIKQGKTIIYWENRFLESVKLISTTYQNSRNN